MNVLFLMKLLLSLLLQKSNHEDNSCKVASNDTGGGEEGGSFDGSTTVVNAFAGNPINFALGYKYQTEVDYSGGALSFVRSYRSDSTWTPVFYGATLAS